jgi:hypothetical protein
LPLAYQTWWRVQAESKLSETEAAERKAVDEYEGLRVRMQDELVAFQSERSQDLSRALRDFALAQAKLARQTASQWRGLADKMRPAVEAVQGAAGAEASQATAQC